MKLPYGSNLRSLFKTYLWLQLHNRNCNLSTDSKGYTLVQLLVASLVSFLVIGIIFSGFFSILKANRRAEAESRRRVDLSRAFDYISNEIRMASRINQTDTTVLNSVTSLEDVVTDAGVNLSDLGDHGPIVLYLEIPILNLVPKVCPPGGPNAGFAPPEPTEYDRVVYDIRPSGSDWLPPRAIHRYGRIPNLDGSIDPCSNPVLTDTVVDAMADQESASVPCTAPAVQAGSAGFQSCMDGAEVSLYLKSSVHGVETQELTSAVSSRLRRDEDAKVLLAGERLPETDTMKLSWDLARSNRHV